MQDIKTKVAEMGDLPSQPVVMQKLQELIGRQDASSHKVAQIVETDQGFTARVLRLVNSPFYGFARKIGSVEDAITMLGFNAVHQLLLTTSMMQAFKIDGSLLNLKDFWKHSFAVGVIAKNLIQHTRKDLKDESFVGGILHDIGRLILIHIDAPRYKAFLERSSGVIDLESEREFFDIDHQELGELLAQKWHFPESIRTAISHHHIPIATEEYKELAAAVNIANMFAHAMGIGNSGNRYVTNYYPEAWRLLKIDMAQLESILDTSLDEIDETEQVLHDLR